MKSKLRKYRRVISLLMAIVMMCTFLAMSASAATIEIPTITPKASTCPQCGGYGFQYNRTVWDTANFHKYTQISRSGCTAGPSTHVHYQVAYLNISRCATCGYEESTTTTRTAVYCPYGG